MSTDPHLVLFFTRNTSLQGWDDVGMFDRETAIYRALQERGWRVTFVTYGSNHDRDYASRIPGIHIICNRVGLPDGMYRLALTHGYPALLSGATIFKSNQLKGADVAASAAARFGRPFVARCGYLHSDFCEREHGMDSAAASAARALERRVFGGATFASVTTEEMASRVQTDYGVDPGRVAVVPNYVETARFRATPSRTERSTPRLIFIGRLATQKNLSALFSAVNGLNVELIVVGSGGLSDDLHRMASELSLPVTFVGNLANGELPAALAASDLFVLPSFYEGHPKALLEAMSCGVAVLGADVPGIRNIISHGCTGWLCGTSPAEIRAAIVTLVNDPELRATLGDAARRYVVDHCSFDRVVEAEVVMLERAMALHRRDTLPRRAGAASSALTRARL